MILTNLTTSSIVFAGTSKYFYELPPAPASISVPNVDIPDGVVQGFISRGMMSVTGWTAGANSPQVGLASLISGEDQVNNWLQTADGAYQFQNIIPTPTAAGVMPNSNVVLGPTGSVGDYLKTLVISVNSNTNASVFIRNLGGLNVTAGTTGTAIAGTTSVPLTSTSAVNWTANQFAGNILSVTYIPTGAVAAVTVKRRVVSHAAVVTSTAITFVVTHALPVGAVPTAWSLEPAASSWEIVPYNSPVGVLRIEYGKRSSLGAWNISVDSGVQVEAVGKFT